MFVCLSGLVEEMNRHDPFPSEKEELIDELLGSHNKKMGCLGFLDKLQTTLGTWVSP